MNNYEISQRIATLIQEAMMEDIRAKRGSGYGKVFEKKWGSVVREKDCAEFVRLVEKSREQEE